MNNINTFTTLLANILYLLMLELFVSNTPFFVSSRKNKLRILFFIIYNIYTFLPNIPYIQIIDMLLFLSYVLLSTHTSFTKKMLVYAKLMAYTFISATTIYSIHSLLFLDFDIQFSQDTYYDYKILLCVALQYIILSLYTTTKKMRNIDTGKTYQYLFNLMILIAVVALSISIMLFGSTLIQQQTALPLVFSLLIIIIVICLATYGRLVTTLEEYAMNKIQLEKVESEKTYYKSVENSLDNLNRLKHDFKNHLIILDGYARKKSYDELNSYIYKIIDEVQISNIITTASPLLSSILNAKLQTAQNAHVAFQYDVQMDNLYLDDYSFITIVGNVIDNAITAAAKMPDGNVKISFLQEDANLLISCVNNHCEQIQKKEGRFLTSKLLNKNSHGIGLRNVMRTVQKKNGTIDIKYDENEFRVNIVLPNYE